VTNDEYLMLRSIAAADGTEGPNFDPALLTELLDEHDAVEKLLADPAIVAALKKAGFT